MTAARRSHEDEGELPSQIGAPESSAGGAGRADPVFHPNNDEAHRNKSSAKLGVVHYTSSPAWCRHVPSGIHA